MKNIGVIGSGTVGQVLANGFIRHGYKVMIGTSNPDKLSDWKKQAGTAGNLGTMEEAAAFGDMLVLAVKGTGAMNVLKTIKAKVNGKTIIDTTNPIADTPPANGVLNYFTTMDESLMERLQKEAPAANFVKAFNSVGNALMVNPKLPGGPPTMFICGNNTEAKAEVKEILDLFGWETEDLGMMEAARPIESLCILWCIPGFLRNQWMHAFKLLKS